MREFCFALVLFFCSLALLGAPSYSQERDRVAGDFGRLDQNADGKLSHAEWHRRGNFTRLDADSDGYLDLAEVRAMYEGHSVKSYEWPPANFKRSPSEIDPGAASDLVDSNTIDRKTLCAITRSLKCNTKAPVKRGLFETGLGPVFPENAVCPGIDDTFALDYSFKRKRETYHGGIDMPAPWGTPMITAGSGTVVGKFKGEKSPRGIEIVIRHAPEDSGLPLWIYTGYAHLDRMPDLEVGQRVRVGEIIGPTGNSGVSRKGRKRKSRRRPAIHFSAFFNETGQYAIQRGIVVPVNGRWLDPIALYRQEHPLDSRTMAALPEDEKEVAVPVKFEDGEAVPRGTKFVWPYMCKRG